jgi:Osmosensitive K+ channel His kinase sensor domain
VRGKFRSYLGAAPGVGKTFAMLAEGGGVIVVLTLPTAPCNIDDDNHHEDQRTTDRSSPANPRR